MQNIKLIQFMSVAISDIVTSEKTLMLKHNRLPYPNSLAWRLNYYQKHAVWSDTNSIALNVKQNVGNVDDMPCYSYIVLVGKSEGMTITTINNQSFERPIRVNWMLMGFNAVLEVEKFINEKADDYDEVLVYALDFKVYKRVDIGCFARTDGKEFEICLMDYVDGYEKLNYAFYKRLKNVAEVVFENGEIYHFCCSCVSELWNILNFEIILEKERNQKQNGYACLNGAKYNLLLFPDGKGLGYIEILTDDGKCIYDNTVFDFVEKDSDFDEGEVIDEDGDID